MEKNYCTCKMPRANDMPHNVGCPAFFGVSVGSYGYTNNTSDASIQTVGLMTPHPPEDWEAAFDALLSVFNINRRKLTQGEYEIESAVKSFIHTLLASKRTELAEKVRHLDEEGYESFGESNLIETGAVLELLVV